MRLRKDLTLVHGGYHRTGDSYGCHELRKLLPFSEVFSSGAALVAFAANVYLWGKIAERLGKNFWLWGILTPVLLGLPVLILAFDGSMPSRNGGYSGKGEKRYIDV